ncbi:TolA-binding protein [Sphingomonas gellani]|uniref:TolA-binding protein n=1 Tax=Sphingomonas gellani TaxID=1166340 RepID=A0A1H8IWS3_9SPHN|nr:tetratricopeptide repeat protein [Sphingomonas gellani]SEN72595.1 TolA-binding protein [Sphingomonas gellani]
MRKPLIVACAATLMLPAAVWAQSRADDRSNLDGRVGKLEGEMRAVQRKVFPNGGGTLIQPDVQAPVSSAAAPGAPATSAVADLTGRVAALERQVANMTGQVEQNGYRIRQLQDQFDAYKRGTDARLTAMSSAAAPLAPPDVEEGTTTPTRTPSRPAVTSPAAATPSRPSATPVAAPSDASVERPSTGDAPEDEYLYGYRLWAAKRYPEAEAQLKKVVAQYPKNRRASYAQNLLGRSYLDQGKPSLASMAFYDNYKKMPEGERAPESLYYLAQSLMKLNKPADACKVYGELTDVYGAKISATMKADVTRGRAAAKCQ